MGRETDLAVLQNQMEQLMKQMGEVHTMVGKQLVQDEILHQHTKQLTALFKKYDEVYDKDGLLMKVYSKQQSCPAGRLQVQVYGLWATVLSLALGVIFKYIRG